jgi:putative hemolysin
MFVEFLILLGLFLVNGYFAMAELAVVSSRRTRLKQLADGGSGGARAALRLLANPTRFLSSVQSGITLIGVLAGVYSGAKFADPLATWLVDSFAIDARQAEAGAFAVVVVLVTYLSLIIGELVPKRWAMTHPEAIASVVARPMEWVAMALAPLVWLLQRSTDAILRLTGLKGGARSAVTEEEVRMLIAEGTREGVFQHAEHRMIEGVLKLADRNVRSVMVPRGEIVWLDAEDSRDAVWNAVQASRHSRYLVCRGEVDELIGVVHVSELVQWLRGGGELVQFARAPLVVQETTTVLKMLDLFRESGLHFAAIVDEHGSIEGLVTPNDVLQAIAGELPDLGGGEVPEAVERQEGSWLVDGRLPIDAAEQLLGRSDMAAGDDYTTLAGFALAQLGHLPATAESFTWKDLRFEIVDMDGRRIDKLLVERITAPATDDTFEPETQA